MQKQRQDRPHQPSFDRQSKYVPTDSMRDNRRPRDTSRERYMRDHTHDDRQAGSKTFIVTRSRSRSRERRSPQQQPPRENERFGQGRGYHRQPNYNDRNDRNERPFNEQRREFSQRSREPPAHHQRPYGGEAHRHER